ncbi:hypothetical protein BLA60_04080 [Actinophytocola xinjiangensis]|uniref:Secreted protein n=1 Tax=Actinophytocola xinjiangensis TaxID=485602 RepID=A0A7Z1B161_9PSEU|nr:hypothetical protein [Actinophytocola xinjiangensis]OLF14320.1 hypothetical protein BLA60_04080 [Actinophytocola xinjiangensis]
MRRRRLVVRTLLAFVVAAASVVVTPSAGATTTDLTANNVAALSMTQTGLQANRLGASGPSSSAIGVNNVPDDQVVCGVGGWKPTWSVKPTVNFGFTMQCNGRWASGTAHIYLFYRFSETDTWTLAAKDEYIQLRGGDSSTLVMQGLPHTLAPCFPAYWYGQVYIEVTFYAGSPLTDWAWFESTPPDPFLSC